MPAALALALALAQVAALLVLTWRLAPGWRRRAPVAPGEPGSGTTVSVVIPTRNEVGRLGACLDGLAAQGAPLVEVLVVDGASTDGTPALVGRAAARDPRIRLLAEPTRPAHAVGRPWAIAAGCEAARGDWILILDADTIPNPGLVAGAVAAARGLSLDAVSFAPRILAPGAGARLLQPAFLTTLIYRFGAVGVTGSSPDRVMANGQCQLLRRDVLARAGGYAVAARSYCDDVYMARHLARHGARVGFLDGRRLFDVVMYETGRETWRAWPRSLNMRDASSRSARWLDAAYLMLVQALPVPLALALLVAGTAGVPELQLLRDVNLVLVGVRVLVAMATAASFRERGIAWWLAPLVDVAAVLRLVQTMGQAPREWRGQAPVAARA